MKAAAHCQTRENLFPPPPPSFPLQVYWSHHFHMFLAVLNLSFRSENHCYRHIGVGPAINVIYRLQSANTTALYSYLLRILFN